MFVSRRETLTLAGAALVLLAAIALTGARHGPQASSAPAARAPNAPLPSPAPEPAAGVEPGTVGVAGTSAPTAVRAEPREDAPVLSTLRAGVLLPVTGRQGSFLAVLTPCEATGWVAASDVVHHPRATGTPRSLREATIVIDPGHGGQHPGAVGPNGLTEATANQTIAERLVERLAEARVFLTRTGDYTAGLRYRNAIANELRAHAYVSLHNNAEPDGPSERPGTETYYQLRSPSSKRLSGLIYEEILTAVDGYEVAWVADTDAGAKFRVNSAGEDYYAILRGARVPAVIVEALFISNAPEEQLLTRPDVQESIAAAVHRALDRYVGTTDPGSGFVDHPYPRPPGPRGTLPAACAEPAP